MATWWERMTGHARRLLTAYLALTYLLAWTAWIPAAIRFHQAGRAALPVPTSPLVILQTVGAAAPTVAAYVVLRVSGHREFGWRGFLLPLLQARFSALLSAIFLGLVW